MGRFSLPLAVAALATSVVGQGNTPLPEVTGPSAAGCGGCMVVADVAGVAFGGVVTQTATNVVVNGNGTRTTVVQPGGQVTFVGSNGAGSPAGPPQTVFGPVGTVITVGGAVLTSPTAYEVFTAFTVINTVSGDNGACQTVPTSSALGTGISYALPNNNVASDYLLQLESSFINQIGFPECSAGGGNVQTMTHIMVTTTTASVTSTGIITPVPASTGLIQTAPQPTAMPSIQPANSGARFSVGWGAMFAALPALFL